MFAVALFCIACAVYWLWSRKNAMTTEPPYLPGTWLIVEYAPLLVGDGCSLYIWLHYLFIIRLYRSSAGQMPPFLCSLLSVFI